MKSVKLSILTFTMAAVLSGCANQQSTDAQNEAMLQNQAVLSVVWMQQSGEYQALAHQAFNGLKPLSITAKHPKVKRKL